MSTNTSDLTSGDCCPGDWIETSYAALSSLSSLSANRLISIERDTHEREITTADVDPASSGHRAVTPVSSDSSMTVVSR
jgi:hypothetical protein